MKNLLKKSIIFILVLPLILLPILNCCLLESAHANPPIQNSHHNHLDEAKQQDSHSHGSQNADTSETEECEWGRISAVLTNQSFNTLRTAKTISGFFENSLFSVTAISNLLEGSAFSLSAKSPPQIYRRTMPIYLQISILRI